MNLVRLTRNSEFKLRIPEIGVLKKEDYESLPSFPIFLWGNNFSIKEIDKMILYKARIHEANAYEICGEDVKNWGSYNCSVSLYRIDKSIIEIVRTKTDGQMQFDFA
jgi:hypothetical protein